MKKIIFLILNFILAFQCPAYETKAKLIQHANGYEVNIELPKSWEITNSDFRNRLPEKRYLIYSPDENFKFELFLSEKYVEDIALKEAVQGLLNVGSGANEVNIKSGYFGENSDGFYVLSKDKETRENQYTYNTLGIRIIENDIVYFRLFSETMNSIDMALLIMESIKF